ncbi:MAG: RIP metalloprotease RseP [Lachnospiraceae bacterium]|nr:RIP metalloprotease RseP [Lachnospiraceae bacterium]
MSIIIAILIFSFIVFFHEFGHFIVAKACNVKVNEFCLGLGPRILHFTKGETTYALRLLPFGGACMMEGEDEESDDERAFNKKTVWQRIAIVFAGPFFNFILAFVLAIVLIACIGVSKPVVSDVMEGYPVSEQGMMAGDEILELNGYNISTFKDVSAYVFFHSDEEIEITYLRDGKEYKTTVVPKLNEQTGKYYIGCEGLNEREKVSALETVKYSFGEIKYQICTVYESLKMLITGQINIKEMSGPVGIVKTIDDTYDAVSSDGTFIIAMNMINIAILLSANLGFMNLLPIPALDGGRLLIYLIEVIRRKQMNEEVEGRIHTIGFMFMMALMIFILVNDIAKLF